jgi:uncharacterized cupredoxin-like copper-binding protein
MTTTHLVDPPARTLSRHGERGGLAALGKVTVIALVGIAIVLVDAQPMLLRRFDAELTTLAAVTLLVTLVVLAGWRWAPLLGALWAALLGGLWSTLLVSGQAGGVAHSLAHPDDALRFDLAVVAVTLALVGFATGIGATLQNYRTPARQRRAPRWLAAALSATVGICIGAMTAAAIPRASLEAGVRPETLASLPAVGAERLKFDTPNLTARAGETVALRLENHDAFAHSFDVDELDVHALMPGGQQSLALFRPLQAGTYTFYCAVPGHRAAGMIGTLVVQS